jgi:hypothetical protein
MARFLLVILTLMCGFGGESEALASGTPAQTPVSAPVIATTAAKAGAQVVSLASSTAGATIYYTVDGSTPTTASPVYTAPFLVASTLTLHAYAAVTARAFAFNIAPGTLVWSDEFTNTTGSNQQPDPAVWTYDRGNKGFGNHELENYCAWGSTTAPCNPASPNAYVGTDGYLHIVAQQPSAGIHFGADETQGLFSLQYGRLEAKIWVAGGSGVLAGVLDAGQ